MYSISDYSYKQAKKIGVLIAPSQKRNYKIDVYDKDKNYLTSIGDKRYSDYPTYIKLYGLEYANKRRQLYKNRHEKDRQIEGSRGFFSDKLLW